MQFVYVLLREGLGNHFVAVFRVALLRRVLWLERGVLNPPIVEGDLLMKSRERSTASGDGSTYNWRNIGH